MKRITLSSVKFPILQKVTANRNDVDKCLATRMKDFFLSFHPSKAMKPLRRRVLLSVKNMKIKENIIKGRKQKRRRQ